MKNLKILIWSKLNKNKALQDKAYYFCAYSLITEQYLLWLSSTKFTISSIFVSEFIIHFVVSRKGNDVAPEELRKKQQLEVIDGAQADVY